MKNLFAKKLLARKAIRYPLYSLLSIILFIIVLFFVLIYTNWGSHQIINLTRYFTKSELATTKISGAIADNLVITGLVYKDNQARIDIEKFGFNWEWSRLFSGEISISKFELETAKVKIKEQSDDQTNIEENQQLDLSKAMDIDLSLLLALKLRGFSIKDSYIAYGDQKYSIGTVQLGSSLQDSIVEINIENADAVIQDQPVNLKTKLTFDTSGDIPALSGSFDWSTNIKSDSLDEKLTGNGRVSGNFSKLTLQHYLIKPWDIKTDVVLGINKQSKLYYSANTNWNNLSYPISKPLVSSGDTNIQINGDNAGLNFQIKSQVKYESEKFDIKTNGSFDWKKLTLKQFDVFSQDVFETSLIGTVALGQTINWNLQSDSTIFQINGILPQLQKEIFQPKVQISGHYNSITQKAKSSIKLNESDVFSGELVSTTNIEYTENKLIADILVDSPYKLKTNIQYAINDNAYEINAIWEQLFWPIKEWQNLVYNEAGVIDKIHLTNSEIALSDKGVLHITGSGEQYQVTTDAKAYIENIAASFLLNGNGTSDRFEIENSDLKTNAGTFKAQGVVEWGEKVNWNTTVNATAVNLETLGLQQSDMQFGLILKGEHSDTATNAIISLSSLAGTIGNETVSGQSDIEYNLVNEKENKKGAVKAKITAYLGKTHALINLTGNQSSDSFDINSSYKINVESMSQLIPGSEGKISIAGDLKSEKGLYHAQGETSLREFKQSDIRCQSGAFNYQINITDLNNYYSTFKSQLSGQFSDLNISGTKLDSVEVNVSGGLESHRLKLKVSGDYNAGMVLDGTLDKQYFIKGDKENQLSGEPEWKGKLSNIWLENAGVGKWVNDNVDISYKNGIANLPNSCFTGQLKVQDTNKNNVKNQYINTLERICLSAEVSEVATKSDIRVEQLDLRRFKSLVPPDIGISGGINSSISIAIKGMDMAQTKFKSRIESDKGILQLTLLDKKKVDLPFTMVVDANMANRQGEYLANIKVNGDLDFDASGMFELPKNESNLENTKIQSNLKLSLGNFEWVDEIWPEFESVDGLLEVDASAQGTLADLSYQGKAKIIDGTVSIIPAGLVLKNIGTTIDLNSEKVVFIGKARSSEGKVSITGDADKNNIYPVNIKINGDKFRVIDTYEASVDISPLLDIQLLENSANLDGSIFIDRAKIRVGDLPDTAVSLSDDVNIIKEDEQTAVKQYQTNANLSVNLGEQFSFKGFGLKTGLKGALNIKQSQGLREGFGELELVDGKFKKFGIKLDIEKGQLIFVGPLENPALNIKAARKLERIKKDEKVSVMIKGTLKKPMLVFPEESTFGQTNAMSNLITGKSMGEKGDGASNGNQALYAVGLSAGGRFKDKVQDELGLDSLEITAAGWMLGKYLTPDLYVSYTTKWLANETQFKLRYNLTRLFTLEAKSGDQQGADIFYTLEKE